jgi:hypothetical protein
MKARRARWVAQTLNPRSAGLRYRCIYPMNELARRHEDVGFWNDGETTDAALTLIFDAWTLFPTVGAPDRADTIVQLARNAKSTGTRIVLDNCDNQFAAGPGVKGWAEGLERVRLLANIADQLVTCSDALATAMHKYTATQAPCRVIDDPVEEAIIFPGDNWFKALFSPTRKRSEWHLARHKWLVRSDRRAGRVPLVWFGNHGNQFSPGGMLDLLDKREILEAVNRDHPLCLNVISNHKRKFTEHFSDWNLPVHYLEWDRLTFHEALRQHDVSIIPSVDNEFTRCKSSNRLVLSAYQGLTVVADPMPSYRSYSDFARIGNWDRNLRELLVKPTLTREENLLNQSALLSRNGVKVIADEWSDVIFGSQPPPRPNDALNDVTLAMSNP